MEQLSLRRSRRLVHATELVCILAACAGAQVGCLSENERSEDEQGSDATAAGGAGGADAGAGGAPATGGESADEGAAGEGSVGAAGAGSREFTQEEEGDAGSGEPGISANGGADTERNVFATNREEFLLGGTSLCDEGEFEVCENFETSAVGQIPPGWSYKKGASANNIGIADDEAARGSQSLRVDIAGGQRTVIAMIQLENLGELAHRHYGRMFYRVQGPSVSESIHFDALEVDGPWMGHQNAVRFAATGVGVGTATSNWAWIYNVQPFDPVGMEFAIRGDRSAHPRVDEWMCLEWFFDADAQEAQYFDDGVPIEYLHIDTERSEIPVLTSLAVGMQKFQPTGALRAWVDEVALDSERIGCNY